MGVKIKERPEGSGIWWIFINYNGKRKAKKIGKDKRVAQVVAKKIEAKLALGEMTIDDKYSKTPTLKEYVYGWNNKSGECQMGWWEKVALLSLKNSTCCNYKSYLNLTIIPALGTRPINEITTRMISDLVIKKVKEGLRNSTVRNIRNCLSAILRHAANPDGFISSNPARGIPVPKPENEQPTKEQNPFTWEERTRIEETFLKEYPAYYPLVVCGFRTGLRIGELIGLQWQDIDFEKKLIFVQRNITRCKITTPKSRSSRRLVRMTSQLTELLKQHKKAIAEKTLKKRWKTMPEWIFVNRDGSFLNYANFIYLVWNKAMDKSALIRRTPHDMRHTYATLRLSKGDSLAEVSKEMGHSKADITYQIYYKWLPSESKSQIDELDMQPDATPSQPDIKKGLH